MTINAVGTSSTQTITNAPTVSGGHHMTMAELQTWLAGRLDQMWASVSDIANGVDARNDAIKKAGELKDDLANGKLSAADAQAQLNALAESLPDTDAEDKQTLKDAAAQLGKAVDDSGAFHQAAAQASNQVVTKVQSYGLGFDPNQLNQAANQGANLSVGSTQIAQETSTAMSNAQSKLTDIGTSWDKQNSLAMTYLQQAMGEAQQAMATVSAIYKSVQDSAMDIIRKFA